MNRHIASIIMLLLVVLTGCATERIYSSTPAVQTFSSDLYQFEFEPQRKEGFDYFNSFRFKFTNKTSEELIIDWENTFYLQNGRNNGHFGWQGMTFEQLREVTEAPLITVAAGSTHSNVIFPLRLIGWKRGIEEKPKGTAPEDSFDLGVVPPGENSINLAVRRGDQLIRKKITVTISLSEAK
jgi:hypothetical protein